MRAVEISEYGDPKVLKLVDVPVPECGANELLVKVSAAGVNFTDIGFREGTFKKSLPLRLGKEACGTVAKIGSEVKGFDLGQRVAATLLDGAYAQYVSGPAHMWVPVPAGVDDVQACAAMMQGMTGHYLTHDAYRIRAGDLALFTAAASGVNAFSIPMAKALGATVIAGVSNHSKEQAAREYGADHVVNLAENDLITEVRKIAGNGGIDVVYDSVGQALFPQLIQLVKPRGTAVLYGAGSGKLTTLDTRDWLFYSINLISPSIENYIEDRAELLERARCVFEGIISGSFKSCIRGTFSLSDVERAHEAMEDRRQSGKIVLLP